MRCGSSIVRVALLLLLSLLGFRCCYSSRQKKIRIRIRTRAAVDAAIGTVSATVVPAEPNDFLCNKAAQPFRLASSSTPPLLF